MVEATPIRFFDKMPDNSGLMDRFGRQLTYLRISVTDRCNMRCDYCRPAADAYQAEPRDHILSYEEIERIARVAAAMGVSKLRITGGEPLVRRDLLTLVEKLAAIPGITDLSMTTNATLLAKYAKDLAAAGLTRINVSLDSLNALRFRKLTGGELAPVLAGIKAANTAGLTPIKLNAVLMRGINAGDEHSEVAELIDFASEHGATIRFIELMPMKQGMDWDAHYISIDEVLQRDDVRQRVDVDAALTTGNTAARYLPLKNGSGDVGFIMPMSERFCEGCNRLRLTSDGGLRSCLPADDQLNLRDLIRRGGSDDDIRAVFLRSALIKPEIGIYDFDAESEKRSMIHIGG
ncbi:MAG: GTP 3',8-cyclase MoaA [Mariprofundus sp.]|nr:GTP 3',8-cyclase MoaA [Mariprofundus sp.]